MNEQAGIGMVCMVRRYQHGLSVLGQMNQRFFSRNGNVSDLKFLAEKPLAKEVQYGPKPPSILRRTEAVRFLQAKDFHVAAYLWPGCKGPHRALGLAGDIASDDPPKVGGIRL